MSENGTPKVIFLAIPNAGAIMPACLVGISQASTHNKIMLAPSQFGDVPHNFNMLWSIALNNRHQQGITHFAMIHTDIKAQEWWLDTLLAEMDRVGADVISAINAIKDARGLSTTGLRFPGLWGTRRFTMTELYEKLPETFSIDEARELAETPAQHERAILAINTGLWVCRFDRGWAEKFHGFTSEHRIVWRDGMAQPEFDSEDWLFSDWAARMGLRVFATRKVKTAHVGQFEFGNDSVWGSLKTDEWRPCHPILEIPTAEDVEEKALSIVA